MVETTKKLIKKYDVCPCWISPCDPGSTGGCEDPEMGDCRYPQEKKVWITCEHFAKECKSSCANWFCELHKDYEQFKKCDIKGCRVNTYAVIDDNGVDIPLCKKHYNENLEFKKVLAINLKKALIAEKKKEYEKTQDPLILIEMFETWANHFENLNDRIFANKMTLIIKDIRKPELVIQQGIKDGWWV